MKKEENNEKFYEEEDYEKSKDEEDIYNEADVEEELDDDELSAGEAGFMEGYNRKENEIEDVPNGTLKIKRKKLD